MLDLCIFLSWFRWDNWEKAILCIIDLYFSWKQEFEVKNVLMMDLFLKNMQLFTLQDVNWWTGVVWITCGLLWCFYQLFGLSFWRHPFTADDPLVSKWCNATFLQICSNEETNSSTSWIAWGWVNYQLIFNFKWTIPLRTCFSEDIQVHLNKLECREKVNFFLELFQKMKLSYILDSLHVK